MPLGASRFELAKWGGGYIVRLPQAESAASAPAKSSLLDKLLDAIRRNTAPETKTTASISFSAMDLLRFDIEQQTKRRSHSPRDARDLSFALRVVGNYLDRRLAREFTVSVNPDSIKVNYDQKQECFTAQHIYDLGIQMYLKRPNRP